MFRRAVDRFTDTLIFRPEKPSYGADYTHPRQQLIAVEGVIETDDGSPARVTVPCILCPSPDQEGATFVILHFHGTSGDIVRSDTWLKLASRVRCHVVNVEYPGYGIMPSGALSPPNLFFAPSEHVILQVANLVFQHLVTHWQWPAQQIVLSGRSMGSGVATFLAKEHPEAAGLVLVSAFSSLQDVVVAKAPLVPAFISRFLMTERFHSARNLANYHGPVVIAHGAADSLIPVVHAHRLIEVVGEKRKATLAVDPQGTHAKVDCASALVAFINALTIRPWFKVLTIPHSRIADGGPDSISSHAADLDAAKVRAAKHFTSRSRWRFVTTFVVLVIGVYFLRRSQL